MAVEWKVILLERQNNQDTEHDITELVDLPRFRPAIGASGNTQTGSLPLTFPIEEAIGVNIRVRREVIAGWRDTNTLEWPAIWYGGYTVEQTGTTEGGEHTLDVDIENYNFLPAKAEVQGWPTNPLDNSQGALRGYPFNYSIKTWLAKRTEEGAPFDGVLPFHFDNDMDFSGVEDVFDGIMLKSSTLLGNADFSVTSDGTQAAPPNLYVYTNVKKILEDMMNLIRFREPNMRPAYWFEAAAFGRTVKPRFMLRDLSDVAVIRQQPKVVFATNPDISRGEYQLDQPFTHKVDGRPIQLRVSVLGVGGDPTLEPNSEGVHPPVYWSEYRDDHGAEYPSKYLRRPGWGSEPYFDNRIKTVFQARKVAERFEQELWGARGIITFETDWIGPNWDVLKPGDVIGLRDEVEGFGMTEPEGYTKFPVQQVTPHIRSDTLPTFTVVCGFVPYDIKDLLAGGTSNIPILMGQTATAAGRADIKNASNGVSGMPRNTVVDQMPVNSAQNTLMPRWKGVAALTIRPAPALQTRPPFDGSGLNNDDDPLPDPVVRAIDNNGNLRDWYDHQDGTNHPHHMPFHFSVDGVVCEPCFDPIKLRRMIVHGSGCLLIEREVGPDIWEELPEPVFYRNNGDGGVVYEWDPPQIFNDEQRMRVTGTTVNNLTIGLSERRPIGDPGGDTGTFGWGICGGGPGGS